MAKAAHAPLNLESEPKAADIQILEERIDDCLALAKSYNQDKLESVVQALRKARNQVIMQQG